MSLTASPIQTLLNSANYSNRLTYSSKGYQVRRVGLRNLKKTKDICTIKQVQEAVKQFFTKVQESSVEDLPRFYEFSQRVLCESQIALKSRIYSKAHEYFFSSKECPKNWRSGAKHTKTLLRKMKEDKTSIAQLERSHVETAKLTQEMFANLCNACSCG